MMFVVILTGKRENTFVYQNGSFSSGNMISDSMIVKIVFRQLLVLERRSPGPKTNRSIVSYCLSLFYYVTKRGQKVLSHLPL